LAAEVRVEPLAAVSLPFQDATDTFFRIRNTGNFLLKYTPTLNHFSEGALPGRQWDF
jgi:hypothetical protein